MIKSIKKSPYWGGLSIILFTLIILSFPFFDPHFLTITSFEHVRYIGVIDSKPEITYEEVPQGSLRYAIQFYPNSKGIVEAIIEGTPEATVYFQRGTNFLHTTTLKAPPQKIIAKTRINRLAMVYLVVERNIVTDPTLIKTKIRIRTP